MCLGFLLAVGLQTHHNQHCTGPGSVCMAAVRCGKVFWGPSISKSPVPFPRTPYESCTVNAVNFAGLIFRVCQHKNIFALSRYSLDIFVLHKYLTSYNDTFTSNWAAQKQSRPHTFSNILPICINTHGQYTTRTCPKCACKISQIFLRVFEFALAEFCAKFAKINVPRIFPLLQYFTISM